eukprot:13519652-Alexandrium_andersonii.AAC.1
MRVLVGCLQTDADVSGCSSARACSCVLMLIAARLYELCAHHMSCPQMFTPPCLCMRLLATPAHKRTRIHLGMPVGKTVNRRPV